MPTRTAVYPPGPNALYKKYGYSPAVRSGDLLFVSGMVGQREDASPEPDLAAQVKLAFANLREVLKAGGCTFDDVVDMTWFMTDPDASIEFGLAEMREAFPSDPLPNITAVGVNWLAGFSFEIKVIARVSNAASATG